MKLYSERRKKAFNFRSAMNVNVEEEHATHGRSTYTEAPQPCLHFHIESCLRVQQHSSPNTREMNWARCTASEPHVRGGIQRKEVRVTVT